MRCRYFVQLAGAGSEAGLWTDIPARFGGADKLADAGSGKAKQTVIVVKYQAPNAYRKKTSTIEAPQSLEEGPQV